MRGFGNNENGCQLWCVRLDVLVWQSNYGIYFQCRETKQLHMAKWLGVEVVMTLEYEIMYVYIMQNNIKNIYS